MQFTVFISPAWHMVTLTPWGVALLLLLITTLMAGAVLIVRMWRKRGQPGEAER